MHAPVHTLAHACHFSERLSTECLAICLALVQGGQWLVHTTHEMCWLLYGRILPCQYELQEELMQAVVVGSCNLQGSIYDQKLLCNSTYITYVCVLLKNLTSLQGKVMSLFHVQDNMRWRRISRQQFLWNVSTCLWYQITEDTYLHGRCCDSHKSHIDHGHLTSSVCLSFPVNLPVVTMWAVHYWCSINKAKCRIW